MRQWIMSKAEISEYIKKANKPKDNDLVAYVNHNGTINDIDYHVEVMKKYYPEGGPLVITFRR